MGGEKVTVWVAFAVNASIAVLKGFAGILTGSSATLAEAAHSVADTANQGLLRISLSLGDRPPDEEHPFGYGKERFLWSLITSLFIFVAGAIFSFARGLYSIVAGEAGGHEKFWLLYAVLGYALVAETISWARALQQTLPEARKSGSASSPSRARAASRRRRPSSTRTRPPFSGSCSRLPGSGCTS